MSETDDFFAGKRPWSVIKDQILRDYMTPYIAKIRKKGQPILLIDGYAGPGIFDDGTDGSPMFMCRAADRYARGEWEAIFINKEKKYHNKLTQVIRQAGWAGSAKTMLGDTTHLLQQLPRQINRQSVFLYLDPFGPTGCDFALLKPFLERSPRFSTEILLTMNMPGMHRLATPRAVRAGRQDEQMIREFHQKLTNVFGGEYWKDILWQNIDAEKRENQLIEAVTSHPGETRESIWFHVVDKHFMQYLEPEYKQAVQRLIDAKKLISPTPRKTKNLNDDCILLPGK